jgi:hypothetical protein
MSFNRFVSQLFQRGENRRLVAFILVLVVGSILMNIYVKYEDDLPSWLAFILHTHRF